MEGWLRFVLARRCINIYFEQTQWQQAADAKRYLSSIIYVFFHCVSISPVQPHPPTLRFTQGGAQAYTLAVMHTVAASTEELHECTHNCLFFLTETSTLATHSKMAPSVFLSLFSAYKETQLRNTLILQYTHTHTHTHTHW